MTPNEIATTGIVISLLTCILYNFIEYCYMDWVDGKLGRDVQVWWSDLTGLIISIFCILFYTNIDTSASGFALLSPVIIFGCHIWFKNLMAWYIYLRHLREIDLFCTLLEMIVYIVVLAIIYLIGWHLPTTLFFLLSGLIVFYFFLPFHRKIKFKKCGFESVCITEEVLDIPLLVSPGE